MRPARLFTGTLALISFSTLAAQTVFWEVKANGQFRITCDDGSSIFWPDNNNWSQDERFGNQPCPPHNPNPPFMYEPSNWTTAGFPDSPGVDVVLSGSSPAILDTSVDVRTLQVAAGFTLEITPTSSIDVHGGAINNDGFIDLEHAGAGNCFITIHTDTNLTGSGTIRFNSPGRNKIATKFVSDPMDPVPVLTIGAGSTLLATDLALADGNKSDVSAPFINNGTVTADTGGLYITGHPYDVPKTNNSLMHSINGGLLRFRNVTIENSSGVIQAGTGSSVHIDEATIDGGQLLGPGTFTIGDGVSSNNVTLHGPLTLANNATMTLGEGAEVFLTGTVTNNATIEIDNVPSGSFTGLSIIGDVTLAGNGEVLFKSGDGINRIHSSDPLDVLTVGPNQHLTTSPDSDLGSRLEARTVNNGTISADAGGLRITGYQNITGNPKVNNSLIRAINGGALAISDTTVTNDEGGGDPAVGQITVSSGSTLSLSSDAVVAGGSISGGGVVNAVRGTLDGTEPLTIAASIEVLLEGDDDLTLKGTIHNDGEIVLRSQDGSRIDLIIDGDVLLDGTGRVVFDLGDNTLVNSVLSANVLTIGANQEVLAGPNSVVGENECRIKSACIINGTITADQGGLSLWDRNSTNNGVLRTLNGGTLEIGDMTLDNSGGVIDLDAAGTLILNRATIMGGSIEGNGTVEVGTLDLTLDGIGLTIGSGITMNLGPADDVTLIGSVTNDGLINLQSATASDAALEPSGAATLGGTGTVIFAAEGDNVVGSSSAADSLTIGPGQTLTTAPSALVKESILQGSTINNGLVEARGGGLTLKTLDKTNNGTFRAADGGELEILDADNILTNYDHSSGILTGGRYEIIASGSLTRFDFQGADIRTLAAGTDLVMSGAAATFAALNLESLQGTLAIRNKQVLASTGNATVDGRLEFGLTDGATDGLNATRWDITGDVDFTGAFVDVTDLGVTSGSYEVVTWTGTRSGALPGIGNLPSGFTATVSSTANSLFLNLTAIPVPPPVLLDVAYDPGTNTATLTYQSINGEAFGVRGGQDLSALAPLPDTAVGDGSEKQYTHNPPGSPTEYFYQLTRD